MASRIRCPTIFGDYALLRPMAETRAEGVYLATSRALAQEGRACVLKVRRLVAGHAPPGVSSITHANLVRVIGRGQVRDQLFIAMPWRSGRDLFEIWNRCAQMRVALPVPIGCRIMVDALGALAALHQGRDAYLQLCPTKILVGVDGTSALAEGHLRIAAHGPGPGFAAGRLGYLAPEQLARGGGGAESDVYAAGAVLWEVLTARRLWPRQLGGAGGANQLAEQVAHLRTKIARTEVAAPSAQHQRVPRAMDAPLLRALARDPHQRFNDAGQFLAALATTGVQPATEAEVSNFLRDIFGDELAHERRQVAELIGQGSVLLGVGPRTSISSPPTSAHGDDESRTRARPEFPLVDLEDTGGPAPIARPQPSPRTPARQGHLTPVPTASARTSGSAGYAIASEPATSRKPRRLAAFLTAALAATLAIGGAAMWLRPGSARTQARDERPPMADPPNVDPPIPTAEATAPARVAQTVAAPAPTPPPPVTPEPPPRPTAAVPTRRETRASNDDARHRESAHPSHADRERATALLKEAQDAYDRSNFPLAIRKASGAVEAGAGADAQLVLGDSYLALERWANAASAYKKALKTDRKSESARLGLRKATDALHAAP